MSTTSERLLEALDALLTEQPWHKLSLGAVAKQAGVSRQTIYNAFGDRQGLARAYGLREAERLLAGPLDALEQSAWEPRIALAEALAVFLAEARGNRMLAAVRSGEDEGDLLALLTTRGDVVLLAAARLDAEAQRIWPGIDAVRSRRLMEIVVRLAISYSNLPAGSPRDAAGELAAVLGSELEALVAARAGQR